MSSEARYPYSAMNVMQIEKQTKLITALSFPALLSVVLVLTYSSWHVIGVMNRVAGVTWMVVAPTTILATVLTALGIVKAIRMHTVGRSQYVAIAATILAVACYAFTLVAIMGG